MAGEALPQPNPTTIRLSDGDPPAETRCLEPTRIITLIHGTFAHDAEWIDVESEFARALQRQLAYKAVFTTFRWSGANSHRARKHAGAALAAHLRRLNAGHHAPRHILIAHSHGGNVACYALEDIEIRKTVGMVVTMGTPFILCTARHIEPLAKFLTILLVDALVFLLAIGIAAVAGAEMAARNYISAGEDQWAAAILVSVPVWLCLLVLTAMLPLRFFEWLVRTQAAARQRLRMPCVGGVHVFSIGAERDEADLLLRQLHRLAGLPAGLFSRITLVFRRLWGGEDVGADFAELDPSRFVTASAKLLLYPVSAGVMGMLVGLAGFGVWGLASGRESVASWLERDDGWFFLLLMVVGLGTGGVILLALLALGAQLLMIVLPPLIRAHRLGFGGESPVDNWLADIRIARDPALVFEGGRHMYREIPVSELASHGGQARLRHSQLYRARSVVGVIADRINEAIDGLGALLDDSLSQAPRATGLSAGTAVSSRKVPTSSLVTAHVTGVSPEAWTADLAPGRFWSDEYEPYRRLYQNVYIDAASRSAGSEGVTAGRAALVDRTIYLDRLFRAVRWHDVRLGIKEAGEKDAIDYFGNRYERWTHRTRETASSDIEILEADDGRLRDAVAGYLRHPELHTKYLDWYVADTLAYLAWCATARRITSRLYDPSGVSTAKRWGRRRVVSVLRWLTWTVAKWTLWASLFYVTVNSESFELAVAGTVFIMLTALWQAWRLREQLRARRLVREMRTVYDLFETFTVDWNAAWREMSRTRDLGAVWPIELYALVEMRAG